jgi:hypothetical protein
MAKTVENIMLIPIECYVQLWQNGWENCVLLTLRK